MRNPFTTVDRYLAVSFLKAGTAAMALLLALFSFMSFAEELEDVGKGAFTAKDAISIVILTTPTRIVDLLPVTALLGSVLGLGTLANFRELIALRAVGFPAWRIARSLAFVSVGLVAFATLCQHQIIPRLERQAQEFRSKTLAQTAIGGTEFWSREDNRFVRVGGVDFGRIPRHIEIYELGASGRLERLVQADRADVLSERRWLLHDVEEKLLGEDAVRSRALATLEWDSFLSQDELATLIAPAHALSASDLYQYVREMEGSGVDTRQYETMLWRQLSQPFALLAMALLGVPFVLGSVRARSIGFRLLVGAGVGIVFYLLEQIASHLALILELPPAPTALAPALLVLIIALSAIRRVA